MKKLLYIGLFLLMWGCERNDVFVYDQSKNSIQFDYSKGNMSLNFDFAFQYQEVIKYPGYPPAQEYYGDAFRDTIISLKVSILGLKSNVDQNVSLKLTALDEEQDTSGFACVELLPPYIFKANHLKDTLYVKLHRPEKRGEYAVGITFDLNDTSYYARGAEEQLVYWLHISDRYPKPEGWNEYYFGEYSEEKYAFYVTALKHPYLKREPYDWQYMYDNEDLRRALDEYNTAHPEAPKDFNFPEI